MKKILSYIGMVVAISLFVAYINIKIGKDIDIPLCGLVYFFVMFVVLIFFDKFFPDLNKSYDRYIYVVLSTYFWIIIFSSIINKILY